MIMFKRHKTQQSTIGKSSGKNKSLEENMTPASSSSSSSMCVLNIQFSYDPDSTLERECKEWLDNATKDPPPNDEFKQVLHIGFAITKYGFERILDDREAKRLKPSTPTQDAIDQARKQVQTAMEQQIAMLRMDKELEVRQKQLDNEHLKSKLAILHDENTSLAASIKALKDSFDKEMVREVETVQKTLDVKLAEVTSRLALKEDEISNMRALFETDKRREVERVQDILTNRLADMTSSCNELKACMQQQENKAHELKEQLTKEKRDDMEGLIAQLNELRTLLSSKDTEIRGLNERLISNSQNEEVQALQRTIQERDMMIAQLKSTNFVKGIQGETVIRDILLKHFNSHEVRDMSAYGAESDIHLVNQNDEITAIEVKYKGTVTNDDVNKSQRDLAYLKAKYGDKLKAYVFFSLKNFNIPKKGGCFEVINDTPVIWHGTDMDVDPHFEKQVVNMVHIAHKLAVTLKTGQVSDVQKLTCFVNTLSDGLKKNKAHISSLFSANNSMAGTIKNMLDNNDALITTVLEYIEENNIGTIVEKRDAAGGPYLCTHCTKEYKSLSGLQRHITSSHPT